MPRLREHQNKVRDSFTGCVVQKQSKEIKMEKQLSQVKEFHKAFGSAIGKRPEMPSSDELALRQRLIIEEAFEVSDELIEGNCLPGAAKELVDLMYVTLGTVLALGLQGEFERCFDAVHASNMSKLGDGGKPVLRGDGKVLKGPNFSPADLSFLL